MMTSRKASSSPKEFWQFERDRREPFGRKYCVHPDASLSTCRGRIVRAHTVQRAGSLVQIARDGHVYRLSTDSAKLEETGGLPAATLVGLKKASTFTGLCSRHDNDTFEPIEKRRFTATPRQSLLVGYRSVLRETYTKRAAIEAMPAFHAYAKTRPPEERARFERYATTMDAGLHIGLHSIEEHKRRFEAIIAAEDYSEVRQAVIHFQRVPDVMAASSWFPTCDFNGRMLQNYRKLGDSGHVPDMLSFSIFAADGAGVAVLMWLAVSDATCNQFVASLLGQGHNRIADLLVKLAFTTSENIYLRPDWWDGIPGELRARLIRCSLRGLHPAVAYRADDLLDHGHRLVSWDPKSVAVRVTQDQGMLSLEETCS